MTALIEIGLLNAPVALCLAGIVLVIGRFWKQPALLHALWVLVLLKLLVPPLVQVPLPWQLPEWITNSRSELQANSEQQANGEDAIHLQQPALAAALPSNLVRPPFWQPIVQGCLHNAGSLFVTALCVWAVGSAIWFCAEGWRIVRFAQVFLRHARLAPKPVQRHASSLARDMGIRRCPEVWLLSAVVSPMLWSVGGRARILFPSQLATQLDKGALATLLTHELAHYHRGDHRVRMLEFVATGLFWWHPAVWMARREIEIHEEQCCDAWVVSQFPKSPRQYADALLATIDFLSEDRTVLPATASGLGHVPMIRQRLILIMRGAAPKSLGWIGKSIVLTMALLIPVQLRLTQKPERLVVTPIQPAAESQLPVTPVKIQRTQESVAPRRFRDSDGSRSRSVPDSSLSRRRLRTSRATALMTPSALRTKANRFLQRNVLVGHSNDDSTGWLVWAMATAPNMLSSIIAHTDGKILWQNFCSDEAEDLSCFEIITVAYAPEGQLFVAGCRDGAIRVWDATNGQLLQTLTGHKSIVRAVAISPQGGWLASGDQQGEVRVWSVLDHRSSEILANYCAPIASVAFSSDGSTVAVATSPPVEGSLESNSQINNQISAQNDRPLVALWNVVDRTEITQIETTSPLAIIAFSKDSSHLSGAEWSGRVLTWNISSANLLTTRFIDHKLVEAAVFTSNGAAILPRTSHSF